MFYYTCALFVIFYIQLNEMSPYCEMNGKYSSNCIVSFIVLVERTMSTYLGFKQRNTEMSEVTKSSLMPSVLQTRGKIFKCCVRKTI